MKRPLSLNILAVDLACSLAPDAATAFGLLFMEEPARSLRKASYGGKDFALGQLPDAWLESGLEPLYDTRVNAILGPVVERLRPAVEAAVNRYGSSRIAVLIGSCDNGSERSVGAVRERLASGSFPEGYRLEVQRADLPARFVAARLGLAGPVMTFSTACASSVSAFASARTMIEAGFCDAAVVGGADIASEVVTLGFDSLEAVSPDFCEPFCAERRGINLGEGAALFLVGRDGPGLDSIAVLGIGESCDAHHMTAPDPEGRGAEAAIRAALADAGLRPSEIDYVNAHGTATELNDAMESKAIARVFGTGIPMSSTKSITGHTLGAAGAIELAFCVMALSYANRERALPAQATSGRRDPALPPVDVVDRPRRAARLEACLSNSFAFGGCNVSIVVGRAALTERASP